jgi:hypothetical protein
MCFTRCVQHKLPRGLHIAMVCTARRLLYRWRRKSCALLQISVALVPLAEPFALLFAFSVIFCDGWVF